MRISRKIPRIVRAERVGSAVMALLTDTEIEEALVELPGWERDDDTIVRDFDRGNFVGAVEFLNAILPIAEAANHHPDVGISWKDVTVSISTHSEGGITANDLALAAEIDAIA
jgi:4a-hydroxytetrahydrobiopterin dehydratase